MGDLSQYNQTTEVYNSIFAGWMKYYIWEISLGFLRSRLSYSNGKFQYISSEPMPLLL